MADSKHSPPVKESEIVITMIAGVIHRWNFWPGTWEPYIPQPGNLLRVWQDQSDQPQKTK